MKLKECSSCKAVTHLWKANPPLCKTCAMKEYKPKTTMYTFTAMGEFNLARLGIKFGGEKTFKSKITPEMIEGVKMIDIASLKQRKSMDSKSISELIKLAVIVVHKAIKKRDSYDDCFYCVSCGDWFELKDGQAGHYLSAGNNSAVRFDERNIHCQCQYCNINLMGNTANYRIALINKIGLEAVEQLEVDAKKPFRWDRSELIQIIKKYK